MTEGETSDIKLIVPDVVRQGVIAERGFSTRVGVTLNAKIEELSERWDRSKSQTIRIMLETYLREHPF